MKKVGIFLRSGFANLGFGAGAMEVVIGCLKHHGIEVVKLMGSSGGSFSIPMHALGEYSAVRYSWLGLRPDKIATINWRGLIKHPLVCSSILNPGPLYEYARQSLSPYIDRAYSDEAIPFEIITTDLETGEAVYWDNNPDNKKFAVEICMASAAIVPFLLPRIINSLLLADGAYSDDMPIKRLVQSGCDAIFVLDVYNNLPTYLTRREDLFWPNLLERAIQVSVAQQSRLRLSLNERINNEILEGISYRGESHRQCQIIHVIPEIPIEHIGFRKFTQAKQQALVELGYWSAKVAMNHLGLDCGDLWR